jgi:hypothetical protein
MGGCGVFHALRNGRKIMLIVPELETVFILVPRTGSGSFYREMRRVYPKAMLLYRHAEAELCPLGYDRWQRVGFVRHPMMRLHSLYTYMQDFAGGAQVQGGTSSEDAARCRAQVARGFDDWVLNNREPWTIPYCLSGTGSWWPVLFRSNGLAENQRSQATYLRPDLGTQVIKFEYLADYMHSIKLDPQFRANQTAKPPCAPSKAAWEHVNRICKWDLEQDCDYI